MIRSVLQNAEKKPRHTYLSEERNLKAVVGFDEVDQVLRPQAAQQVTDVRPDKGVVHDRRPVIFVCIGQ